jgi:mRNA interferase RelE/StbE
MPYEIIISPRALKDLKNLSKDVTARIVSTLEQMQNDPINSVYRLQDSPLYSVHVGEYRVILDILHKKLIILVVRVGHRRNIYKKI